ncbi:MAG: hypothetical protein MMC33_009887 [Icmadophila ericetorum]|nr:hypothetical protein [Icmadophila ericetorum]
MSSRIETPSPTRSFDQRSDGESSSRPHSGLKSEIFDSWQDDTESLGSTPASSIGDIAHQDRLLRPGVYVPTLAFFDRDTEDLDLETISKHSLRLAQAGVAGLTTQGSNGEAVHLTHKERMLVTSISRRALNEAGFRSMPIIVGCGSQSTRESIEFCNEAAHSGGDCALVLPPSYYQQMYKADFLLEFFTEVADASPIPILIYNFPAAVSGLDMDSDTIIKLAKHPNIVGCKLTCGNTGKLNRIAAATNAATLSDPGSGFMCMGGSADFTLQTLVGGGSGVICGLGNIVPKACVEIIKLFEMGELEKARKLQTIVARGDWAAITGGIVGTKSALETYFGYGGFARRPLPTPTPQDAEKYAEGFKEVVELENTL